MAKTKTTRYDVAEYLRTPEEMAAYLEACFEEADGDAAFVAKALGNIARAKGMTEVARDAGLSRESLYKALSGERTPGFDTILKVINAMVCVMASRVLSSASDLRLIQSMKLVTLPHLLSAWRGSWLSNSHAS